VNGVRSYRLRAGLFRVVEREEPRLVLSDGEGAREVSREEAAAWLVTH